MKKITRIRKEVMLLANALNKKIKDLSESLKRAWSIIKAKKLYTKISGVTFGSRQTALKRLEKYAREKAEIKTSLVRESDNKADPSAIKIMVAVNGSAEYHLGYVPADIAALLAPIMDKLGQLPIHLLSIVGGYAERATLGARFVIHI
ncbi:MAG: HIRAN domain-containing protein [bacterium]|nr:HIRAN domain-containing protein [bacterium]